MILMVAEKTAGKRISFSVDIVLRPDVRSLPVSMAIVTFDGQRKRWQQKLKKQRKHNNQRQSHQLPPLFSINN
jgi:hypothetical protein